MVGPQIKRKERRDRKCNEGHHKGVRMRKWGKWVAEVRQPNSRDRIWLGSYDTAEEAARAYDAAAFCLRGPSAILNFPNDPPEITLAGKLSPSEIQSAASIHARRRRRRSGDESEANVVAQQPRIKPEIMEFGLLEGGGGRGGCGGSENLNLFGEFSSKACYLNGKEGGGDDDRSHETGSFLETQSFWNF